MDILQKNIVKELGLENLPENEKEETYLRISKIIYQNVMIRVVELLSEENQNELDGLFDKEIQSEEESNKILEFLRSKIDNFDDIVVEEIVNFKKESFEVMKEVSKEN